MVYLNKRTGVILSAYVDVIPDEELKKMLDAKEIHGLKKSMIFYNTILVGNVRKKEDEILTIAVSNNKFIEKSEVLDLFSDCTNTENWLEL